MSVISRLGHVRLVSVCFGWDPPIQNTQRACCRLRCAGIDDKPADEQTETVRSGSEERALHGAGHMPL